MIDQVSLPLIDMAGRERGQLHLACLSGQTTWNGIATLVDRRGTIDATSAAAPVQLLEEIDYDYRIDAPGGATVIGVEPRELVSFSRTPTAGRLMAQRATGTVTFGVELSDRTRLRAELEIRSRKLDYETDYRSMLLRIAREAAELVQTTFAASSLRSFQPDTLSDPKTLYQRYAFMQSLLQSDDVQHALHLIERRPHHQHLETTAWTDPARGVRSGRQLAYELTAPGPRQPTARPVAGLDTLPKRIRESTHSTTYDTVPNRFVKYVLTRWRNLAVEVGNLLGSSSASDARGRREALIAAETLTQALTAPALCDAGRLESFPQSNQVLQGRSGYREILEAFLLAEAAATIDWHEHDQLFAAGQRDVATLYEYWVFLELIRIVENIPGFDVDKRELVKHSADGLRLDLRRTGASVVEAHGHCRGRPVTIEVWFNRQFSHSKHAASGTSWSESLRPDCSIRVRPQGGQFGAETWLHFDAKYRVASATDIVPGEAEGTAAENRADRPIPQDLLKMHAYRDAIRRTAGSYVLYPGSGSAESVDRRPYHEILPGLGAFVLRPSGSGEATRESTRILGSFLEEIIDHVAAQGTSAERALYWTNESYRGDPARKTDLEPALTRPALDTGVLLGFVRGRPHLDWCRRTGLYNLRADPSRRGSIELSSPELGSDFVVLYDSSSEETWTFSATGAFFVRTRAELFASGYPDPRGNSYVCLEVRPQTFSNALGGERIRRIVRARKPGVVGAPVVVTWSDLMDGSGPSI